MVSRKSRAAVRLNAPAGLESEGGAVCRAVAFVVTQAEDYGYRGVAFSNGVSVSITSSLLQSKAPNTA